jgi:hypothetical protein
MFTNARSNQGTIFTKLLRFPVRLPYAVLRQGHRTLANFRFFTAEIKRQRLIVHLN